MNQLKQYLINLIKRIECVLCKNILNAVSKIFIDIESKIEFQTILFSPACSSYDQFKNFEERGDYFKTIINQFVNVLNF